MIALNSRNMAAIAGRTAWDAVQRGFMPLLMALACYWLYRTIAQGHVVDRHYFVPLAQALMQGKIEIAKQPDFINEVVKFDGRTYIPFPFMPAIMELPWVYWTREATNQLQPCLFYAGLNAALVYSLMRRLNLDVVRRIVFTFTFFAGTIVWYGGQDGGAWHYAQTTAITCLLLAIREVFGGQRAWIMGVWLGCAAMCRLPELMAFPFFVAFLLHKSRREPATGDAWAIGGAWPITGRDWLARYDWKAYAGELLAFGLALGAFVALYLGYNYVRFESATNTGYALIPGILNEPWYRDGFFNLKAIPRNFYTMFLKAPAWSDELPWILPNKNGAMSIFFTTPAFLWCIKSRGWGWFPIGCWLSVLGVMTPIFLHGEIGGVQFGYRYAMDFYPFLLLLMAKGMGPRFSFEQGAALALGAAINAWGFWAVMTNHWSG